MFVKFLGEMKCMLREESFESTLEKIRNEFDISENIILMSKTGLVETEEDLVGEVEVKISLLGGKKKKKKQYTTPKKNKHRHKNKKLLALSFYAIDKEGKVQKVKKSCP